MNAGKADVRCFVQAIKQRASAKICVHQRPKKRFQWNKSFMGLLNQPDLTALFFSLSLDL
jgi:hypothetical protein